MKKRHIRLHWGTDVIVTCLSVSAYSSTPGHCANQHSNSFSAVIMTDCVTLSTQEPRIYVYFSVHLIYADFFRKPGQEILDVFSVFLRQLSSQSQRWDLACFLPIDTPEKGPQWPGVVITQLPQLSHSEVKKNSLRCWGGNTTLWKQIRVGVSVSGRNALVG